MPLFSNRYQKTSFIYSFMLSLLYIPFLISLLEENLFIKSEFWNMFVFNIFTVVFITTLNYKIMLCLKKKGVRFNNRVIFIPINLFVMYCISLLIPFEISKDIFYLSLLLITIPWLIFFKKVYRLHKLTL